MSETTSVQVRDVPTEAVETLKARASRRGRPLTAYLRELILEEASLPELEELLTGPAVEHHLVGTRRPIRHRPSSLATSSAETTSASPDRISSSLCCATAPSC